MHKQRLIKFITWFLSGIIIFLVGCLFLFGAVNSSDSDYADNSFVQIHTVSVHKVKNSIYAKMFDDLKLTPMDGSNNTPDLCLPALCKNDGFVPQGLAYYAEKDWFLISSYSSEKANTASVIFALDAKTGDLKATYALYNTDNTPFTGHVGGIGVSNNNLYITTDDATVSYVPLSLLETQNGSEKSVKFSSTADFKPYLGAAATSYLSVTDNVLCMGNFYHTADGYEKKASDNANSIVLSYSLNGDSSETEWASLTKAAPEIYSLPNSVSKVQSAVILGSKMYLSSSYGRRNNSTYYVIDISNGTEIKEENIKKYECLPMMEGMAVKNNELYFITESAAYNYYGKNPFYSAKNPTDVIWKIE